MVSVSAANPSRLGPDATQVDLKCVFGGTQEISVRPPPSSSLLARQTPESATWVLHCFRNQINEYRLGMNANFFIDSRSVRNESQLDRMLVPGRGEYLILQQE